MNKIIVRLQIVVVAFLISSCSESLDDINISPNTLPDNEVDIKFVFTGVVSKAAQISTNFSYRSGELPAAAQYLQRDFTSYEENNYDWNSVSFGSVYEPIKDSKYIFDRAGLEKTGDEKNFYQAVSLIMKSYSYGFLTSAFGDIPYSKAMQAELGGQEYFQPVYDSQKDVFIDVLKDLVTANTLLKDVGVVDSAIDADLVFQGDSMKWRKFANSLRLRFYMRLSQKNGMEINPSQEFSEIINNPSQFPIMEDNYDNAEVDYVGTDANNSWPGGPLNFSLRSEFYRRKPSATIVSKLINLNDPRLTTWIKPVDVQIVEGATNEIVVENGLVKRYIDLDIDAINSDSDLENDIKTSLFVGLDIALTSPNDFNLGGTVNGVRDDISALDENIYLGEASNPHVSYLADMYAENSNSLVKSVFMSCAEVKFILAEASLLGWSGGNAYDYYTDGIEKSFEQYNITDGSPSAVYDKGNQSFISFNKTDYLANTQNIYNNSSNKLEAIISQKWIALWMTSESWFDWRRTGFPKLNDNILFGTNGQNTPIRFWYDDIYNEDNMTDAVNGLQPATNDQWSQMWLLQGN